MKANDLLSPETLLLCLSLLPAVSWMWFQWSHRRLLRVARSLPNVMGSSLPLLGDLHHTIHGTTKLAEVGFSAAVEAMKRGLKTFCFWCGPLPLILICDPGDVQKILNSSSTFEKADEMDYLKYALGDGLLTAPGHIWKVTRKHLNPLFHPRNLEHMVPVFNRSAREFLDTLAPHASRGPLDILEPFRDITLKTICHFIFGPDLDFYTQSKGFRGLRAMLKNLPQIVTMRTIRVWLRNDWIFHFLYKKELKEMEDMWIRFTSMPLKVAKENNTIKNSKKWLHYDDANFGPANNKSEELLNLVDVYSVLQEKYPQFTDKELQDEMVTLYLTGENTVAFTVATMALALAQYPDIQERLYQEVSSAVALDDDVTPQDLARMPYLDQVWKETLRWSTFIPVVARKAAVDLKLSSCTIPAGSSVMVCLFALHLDPHVYPDPQKFDPERFAKSTLTDDQKRPLFIPFSSGPRNCIGQKYAQMFVKVLVVQLLRRYRLSTTQDMYTMRRKMHIALEGVDGYNVALENRHTEKS